MAKMIVRMVELSMKSYGSFKHSCILCGRIQSVLVVVGRWKMDGDGFYCARDTEDQYTFDQKDFTFWLKAALCALVSLMTLCISLPCFAVQDQCKQSVACGKRHHVSLPTFRTFHRMIFILREQAPFTKSPIKEFN